MSNLLYILLAIVIFGVLIMVHELGHFLAARACGVRVLEFAMGMGPVLLRHTTKKGTDVTLRALPLGGFCAMAGEDDDADDAGAFQNAPRWKRLIIMLAGVVMNFLLGLIILFGCYTQVEAFSPPTVTRFMAGCPYESADGLQVGDTFYKVNGQRTYLASDVSFYMARGEEGYADLVLIRDGHKVRLDHFPMTLREYTDEATGETVMRYGLYFEKLESGLGAKLKYTWYGALDFVRMVWLGLHDLVTGAAGAQDLMGIVGVVDGMTEIGAASPTVSIALLNIFYMAALIAVNLAVMNLLPIPGLDGGRIFFLLLSALWAVLFRRELDPKYENYASTAGFVLLLGLMVYVTYNDVARIIAR